METFIGFIVGAVVATSMIMLIEWNHEHAKNQKTANRKKATKGKKLAQTVFGKTKAAPKYQVHKLVKKGRR